MNFPARFLKDINKSRSSAFIYLASIGEGGQKTQERGDAKQSPDARHLLSHLACRFQPDYTFIPPQWQMCQRCAGPADVPHCAFSPFFRPRLRHITPHHMEMQGALTFLYNCQGSVRGVTSKNYLHRILLLSIQRSRLNFRGFLIVT